MSGTKTYVERAIKDGHAKFSGEGKDQRINYLAANHSPESVTAFHHPSPCAVLFPKHSHFA